MVWQTYWVIVLPCIAWLGGLGMSRALFHVCIETDENNTHTGSMMYILDMFASGVINGERGLLIYIFTFVANGSATGPSHLLLAVAAVPHICVQHSLRIRSGRWNVTREERVLNVPTAASGPSCSCSSNLARSIRLSSLWRW